MTGDRRVFGTSRRPSPSMALTFASNCLLSKSSEALPTESSSITSNDPIESHLFLSNGLLSQTLSTSHTTSSKSLSNSPDLPFDVSFESPVTQEFRSNGLLPSRHHGGVSIPSAHSIDALLADDEMDDGVLAYYYSWTKGAN